jgi:hypothetical protein
MKWLATSNPPEVMPLDDLKLHESGMNCWCKPADDDGVIVHHSMDKREEYENGRKPS